MQRYVESGGRAQAGILDLKEYDFPLFDERLAYMDKPSERVVDFTRRFNQADGIIIVSPVYNADYPAALKNIIDLYGKEWAGKPVAVVSVTAGPVPGIATAQKLQVLLLKLGARVSPQFCTVINAGKSFDEAGETADAGWVDKFMAPTVDDLLDMAGQ